MLVLCKAEVLSDGDLQMVPHNAADATYTNILSGIVDEGLKMELEDLALDIDVSAVLSTVNWGCYVSCCK